MEKEGGWLLRAEWTYGILSSFQKEDICRVGTSISPIEQVPPLRPCRTEATNEQSPGRR